MKTSPRIGLVDDIFCNNIESGYKGSPGYKGEPGCLFVPSWQGITADLYIHLIYDRHPLYPNNVDCMTYELAGAATKDMLRASSRGRCAGYEVLRSCLIDVNKACEKVYAAHQIRNPLLPLLHNFTYHHYDHVDSMLHVKSSERESVRSNAQRA